MAFQVLIISYTFERKMRDNIDDDVPRKMP
jgi:hypothetical protein